MSRIIDRLILLLICICCTCLTDIMQYRIVFCLVGIIYAGVAFYTLDSRVHPFVNMVMGILMVLQDGFITMLPLFIYECFWGIFKKDYRETACITGAFIIYVLSCMIRGYSYVIELADRNVILFAAIVFSMLLGIYLSHNTTIILRLKKEKLKIRDDSEELRQVMTAKNRLMREQQDNNITMATLKERNRIAREIHDNVGHLLSRSLLQVGALRTIYKEEPLSESLMLLQETLNESMTNVRNSVHDLHNESFDLHKAVNELIGKHPNFSVNFDYDMSDSVPRQIKYCFFSIITEAFQNADKYSTGDRVEILVREHPGIYQAVFWDNGQNSSIKETGIGLHNMQSRVDELGGTLVITNDNGFRIFISIPKKGV